MASGPGSSSDDRVGFVGLGIMGWRMAANLARADYELTVFNGTRAKAEAWAGDHGGTVAGSPADVGAASGSAEDFARCEPLFGVMGELVVHVGPLGHGEIVKLINNAVAAANCATVGEALLVGQATGVDLEALIRVMGEGSGGSAARARDVLVAAMARELGDDDFVALIEALEAFAGLRLTE